MSSKYTYLLLCLLYFGLNHCIEAFYQDFADLFVETSTGNVRGKIIHKNCEPVKAWLGIPYAKPPVGSLRFKPPQPVTPWNHTLDATKQPNACYQKAYGYSGNDILELVNETMSEDCLYLNIVAPVAKKCKDQKLPVLVWFPILGYSTGSIGMPVYNFQCLSTLGDVIVVSANVRLSALGFLRIDDNTAAGNMGLLDQQQALRWIHENIEKFGGDSERITLLGHTHGSVAAAMHLVSSGSQGLFDKLILMNGVPNDIWGIEDQAKAHARAEAFAASLNCPVGNSTATFECLLTKDPYDLTSEPLNLVFSPFLPTIDGIFINDTVQNLLVNKNLTNIRIIIGTNLAESNSYALIALQEMFGISVDELESTLNKTLIEEAIQFILNANGYTYNSTYAEALYDFFFNQTQNNFQAFAQILNSWGVSCSINDFAFLVRSRGATVYKYVFNHTTSCTAWGRYIGASRGEDLLYLLGSPHECNFPISFSCEEKSFSLGIIWYFTQFARIGVPNRNWMPYTLGNEEYAMLNIDGPVMLNGFRKEQCLAIRQILASP